MRCDESIDSDAAEGVDPRFFLCLGTLSKGDVVVHCVRMPDRSGIHRVSPDTVIGRGDARDTHPRVPVRQQHADATCGSLARPSNCLFSDEGVHVHPHQEESTRVRSADNIVARHVAREAVQRVARRSVQSSPV